MFSALTTGYLFLGGAGAGACAVLSVLECATARVRVNERLLALSARAHGGVPSRTLGARIALHLALPSEFFARAWPSCVVLLMLGTLCLVVDLGRPDRLPMLIVSPQMTPMAVGAFSLMVCLVCATAFSCFSLLDTLVPTRGATLALACVGLASGVVTAAYTGVLLCSLASVLAFQTPLLPAVFALSSLSCGLAVALGCFALVEARYPHARALFSLVSADSVIIVAEMACAAAFAAWLALGERTAASAQALLVGDLAGVFWGGVVVCGLVLPLVLERVLSQRNESFRVQLMWTAACVLVGGCALRFCVVGLAAFDVTQMPGALLGLV